MKTVALLWSWCNSHESERMYFSRHQIPEYVNKVLLTMMCLLTMAQRNEIKEGGESEWYTIGLILKTKGGIICGAHFQKYIQS